MQQTVVPGIAMWSAWQPDRNLFFNSFFVEHPGGNLAVDPLALSDADAAEVEARGGVAWVVLTNRDHERAAAAVAERFRAKVAASEREAALFAVGVDRPLNDGETIGDLSVVTFDGLKTPGEIALFSHAHAAAIVGDALWGSPAGSLRFMPEEKLANPAVAALSLRRLRALRPEHLLLGDGAPLFGNAYRALADVLERRTDVYVNRINRDEVPWHEWRGGPGNYRDDSLEIGDYIGAEKIGFRLARVPPGAASCPLHWHTAEEELFVVLSGESTLITPRGEFGLRAGDFVTFPTSERGAHKIENRGTAPCEMLLIANTDANDVCSYPDSRKVLVERRDLLVRDNPELDYWDGE